MFKIQTLNKISVKGLERFPRERFEVASEISHPDALVLRSFDLHSLPLPSSLKCVGRAGAGVNNIPIPSCSERGIVVFNTPGANANAVKELVLLGMLLAARDVLGGVQFSHSLRGKGADVGPLVEKGKAAFSGYEIKGKKLGVIGLGAIGLMVANAAVALEMEVEGYDPFISVDRAWELSRSVRPATSLERMLKTADFVTIHVPYSEKTKGFINKDKIEQFKPGAVLLNFSRAELIAHPPLLDALNTGKLSRYVTDFPTDDLLVHDKVLPVPHLGASTVEAEENCAMMIADQVKDFLENGNIQNSVNFPDCRLDRAGDVRLVIANHNVPNMVGQITTLLAQDGLNISEMVNKSRGDLAYSIVDINGAISEATLHKILAIQGVITARIL